MDYSKFTNSFYKKANINLFLYKEDRMKRRIDSFIKQTLGVLDYQKFFNEISSDNELYLSFLDHLTINVTEFFRNKAEWDNLKTKVIPDLLKTNSKLTIWSAGCSTGEEPYSLSMLIDTHFPRVDYSILATDLDRNVLARCKTGVYSSIQVKGLEETYFKKYFSKVDPLKKSDVNQQSGVDMFVINKSLINKINFKQHNLLEDPFPKKVDLILCRNVVIYFTEEAKEKLYERFSDALRPGGVLLIGNTEHIVNYRELGLVKSSTWCFIKQ